MLTLAILFFAFVLFDLIAIRFATDSRRSNDHPTWW